MITSQKDDAQGDLFSIGSAQYHKQPPCVSNIDTWELPVADKNEGSPEKRNAEPEGGGGARRLCCRASFVLRMQMRGAGYQVSRVFDKDYFQRSFRLNRSAVVGFSGRGKGVL